MQALVTCNASYPNYKIAGSVCRCDPGRPPAVLTLAPGKHDRRWICCGNLVGPNRSSVIMKSDIRSLTGVVRDSRGPSVNTRDIGLCHRLSDTAEIITINQVSVGIFAERKHKLRRRSSRHVDHSCADPPQIGVGVIKRKP